jgi:hypothetical protein
VHQKEQPEKEEKKNLSTLSENLSKDSWKSLAFQIGQTLCLCWGLEVYTKSEISEKIPALKCLLERNWGDKKLLSENRVSLEAMKNELFREISGVKFEYKGSGIYHCKWESNDGNNVGKIQKKSQKSSREENKGKKSFKNETMDDNNNNIVETGQDLNHMNELRGQCRGMVIELWRGGGGGSGKVISYPAHWGWGGKGKNTTEWPTDIHFIPPKTSDSVLFCILPSEANNDKRKGAAPKISEQIMLLGKWKEQVLPAPVMEGKSSLKAITESISNWKMGNIDLAMFSPTFAFDPNLSQIDVVAIRDLRTYELLPVEEVREMFLSSLQK